MTVHFLDERYSLAPPRVVARFTTVTAAVEVRENSTFRWLLFGNGVVQSAMELKRPARLVLPYTQSMMSPLLFAEPPREVLLLGLGGGSLVRYVQHRIPGARLTAVEVNAEIVALARDHFAVADEPQGLRVHTGDARAFLAGRRRGADLMLVDLFGEDGMPGCMAEPGFYHDCHANLSARGVLSVNLLGSDERELGDILRAIRAAFRRLTLCTTLADYQNVIVLAFKQRPVERSLAALHRRARAAEQRYALPLPRILRNIAATNPTRDGMLVI